MSKPSPSSAKPPRRVSAASLQNAALHYLERFAASADSLRRVLLRRVERAARFHGDDPALGAALVEELIVRYRQAGLLDDSQFAAARGRSLLRRGASPRAIRQTLAAKGVETGIIDATLQELRQETGDLDQTAALAYARRRRLGPFRPPELRAEMRQRDLAALARAGFSWEVACRVLEPEDGTEETG